MAGVSSSVVDGALGLAKSAAAEEIALQLGVKGDLEVIKDELELMRSYLMVTDEERSRNPVAKAWARQVRDVAYDVEDYIEDFAVHLGSWSPWWCCCPAKVLKRRRIASGMKELRGRVDRASKRRKLYGPIAPPPNTPSSYEHASSTTSGRPDGGSMPSPGQDQEAASLVMARVMGDLRRPAGVVGLSKLLARSDRPSLMVVSMCVTAATPAATTPIIGKAYDELVATGQFQCHAWVKLQDPFCLTALIRSLLRQFHANAAARDQEEHVVEDGGAIVDVQKSIEVMRTDELITSLAEKLENKRYLVVIDDVPSREEWDSIKLYVRPGIKNASRIIATSKREDVARYCAGGLLSYSFYLSSYGAVLPAFCNMEPLADEAAEASYRANNPETIASAIGNIEEPRNNSRAIVGRVKEMDWLIRILLRDADTKNKNAISVCGMRGIGKTALVENVYRHQSVVDYFTHRAWVTMSNLLSKDKLLRNVLLEFKLTSELQDKQGSRGRSWLKSGYLQRNRQGKEVKDADEKKKKEVEEEVGEEKKEEDQYCPYFSPVPVFGYESTQLIEFYEMVKHNQQCFRCLLVLDGVSTTDEWDFVKSSLLLEEYKVIRIIVTTRERQVADYCSRSGFVYDLNRLHEDDAANLFYTKVFGTAENVRLGPCMVEQSNKILYKCGGIPFAIVAIGQHLASRPRTAREWETCSEHLNMDPLQGSPGLGLMRRTLESCYTSLPYHFKYCFQYLSIFQEDVNITRRRLVKRWIAEGYVSGIRGSEAEEVGEKVFSDFLNMMIIEPTKYERKSY